MQVLNVWLGGALIGDIPSMVPGACGHSVQEPRHGAAHGVAIEPGCRAAVILGGRVVGVNSRHHQALRPDALGRGLMVTGRAPDGVIEAVELPGERFVVGVQWHPEDMAIALEDTPERLHARALFEAFAQAARDFDRSG
jgi:putative glutamine amidotransferase